MKSFNPTADRIPRRDARIAIRAIFESLRPTQWVKNIFVLAPLIFAGKLTSVNDVVIALGVFALLCAVTSGNYLLNDLIDYSRDQHHPMKKTRAIASGRVRRHVAAMLAILLIVLALVLAHSRFPRVGPILAIYLVIGLAYSLLLKRILFLDVFSIGVSFVLRVLVGAAAINVSASHWLLLCTFLLALFLGFSKRRHEILVMGATAQHHRSVLGEYSIKLVDQANVVLLGATIVCYALYTVAPETVLKFGTDQLIYSVPFVIFGMLRYLYLVQRKEGGDPTLTLVRDKPLVICLALWAFTCVAIIYGLGSP